MPHLLLPRLTLHESWACLAAFWHWGAARFATTAGGPGQPNLDLPGFDARIWGRISDFLEIEARIWVPIIRVEHAVLQSLAVAKVAQHFITRRSDESDSWDHSSQMSHNSSDFDYLSWGGCAD